MTYDLFGWHLALNLVDYKRVHDWQHGLVRMRENGFARDTIITVEHPNVITVGKDGHPENYAGLKDEPVFVERGGDVTYHGPGQLVAYFIFNLNRRGRDLHTFMENIQDGVVNTLADYEITARKDDEYTGVWVNNEKIASVGIAVKKWISYHGVAINLNTTLDEFKKINPCGLDADVMTSASKQTGQEIDFNKFRNQLVTRYSDVFKTDFMPIDLESIAEDVESQAGGYEI